MLVVLFCFKRKMCETLWRSRDVLCFCPSNTDLAIEFFLTREINLVIIYCHDVNDDYDHLFTHCTRCPPACLCEHERSDNDRMAEDVMKMVMMMNTLGVSVMLQC